MARDRLTYSHVKAACEQFRAQGQKITLDGLLRELGRGSYTTIIRFYHQWLDEKRRAERVKRYGNFEEVLLPAVGAFIDSVELEIEKLYRHKDDIAQETLAKIEEFDNTIIIKDNLIGEYLVKIRELEASLFSLSQHVNHVTNEKNKYETKYFDSSIALSRVNSKVEEMHAKYQKSEADKVKWEKREFELSSLLMRERKAAVEERNYHNLKIAELSARLEDVTNQRDDLARKNNQLHQQKSEMEEKLGEQWPF